MRQISFGGYAILNLRPTRYIFSAAPNVPKKIVACQGNKQALISSRGLLKGARSGMA